VTPGQRLLAGLTVRKLELKAQALRKQAVGGSDEYLTLLRYYDLCFITNTGQIIKNPV
jgi:hypothetical protein